MIQDDVSDRVPFDTAIVNFHTYSSNLAPWHLENEIASLSEHIRKSVPSDDSSNSLWRYFGVSSRAHSLAENVGSDDRIAYLARQVDAIREQLTTDSTQTTLAETLAESYVRHDSTAV